MGKSVTMMLALIDGALNDAVDAAAIRLDTAGQAYDSYRYGRDDAGYAEEVSADQVLVFRLSAVAQRLYHVDRDVAAVAASRWVFDHPNPDQAEWPYDNYPTEDFRHWLVAVVEDARDISREMDQEKQR